MNNPFQSVIDQPIVNDKTIKDLLTYNGTCYWWFIDHLLYQYINTKTHLIHNKSLFLIVNIVCRYFKPLFLIYDILASFLWSIITKIYCKNCCDNNKKLPGVFLYRMDMSEWRTVFGSLINLYHNDIAERLTKSVIVKSVYEIPIGQELLLRTLRKYMKIQKQGKHFTANSLPIITYWSKNVWNGEIKAFAHFGDVFTIIDHNPVWYDEWNKITGLNAEDIRMEFKIYLQYVLPILIRNQILYNNMFQAEKPMGIAMRDEQTPSGRGIVLMAKLNGVPTIGIQHGGIAKHASYLYHETQSDRLLNNRCPIPDVTLVWGKSEHDLLINNNYPHDGVVITGNPRYDVLNYANTKYSRDRYCKSHGIDINKKIILWATQSHGWDLELNHQYLHEIFSTITEIDDVVLIIKQHPNEKGIHDRLIQESIDKYNTSVIIHPDKSSDSTELVFISDILIIESSTLGQEGVVFHKPIIVMDFSKKPDYAEYVKEGVAIGVFKQGTLKNTIVDILNNNFNFKIYQDKYIINHMGVVDGNSSQKCANVILSVCDFNT